VTKGEDNAIFVKLSVISTCSWNEITKNTVG